MFLVTKFVWVIELNFRLLMINELGTRRSVQDHDAPPLRAPRLLRTEITTYSFISLSVHEYVLASKSATNDPPVLLFTH